MSRVAMITGGAGGLGLACARRFGNDGLRLALVDIDSDGLRDSVASIASECPDVIPVPTDVRTASACRAAVGAAVAAFGRVDILVNAAGVYPRVAPLEITEEQWRLDFDVNVLGTYFMMVEAIGDMQTRDRGHIVNVSSVDAFIANPQNAHYAATKAAVLSLTRSIAQEVAPLGILVNAVAPGPMATDQAKTTGWYGPMVEQLPTGNPIEPAEVADTVSFLCRDQNVSITGETVIVSGGGVIA